MAIRIIELHRILKNTGSFYLHCDPTMSTLFKDYCLDIVFLEKIILEMRLCGVIIKCQISIKAFQNTIMILWIFLYQNEISYLLIYNIRNIQKNHKKYTIVLKKLVSNITV